MLPGFATIFKIPGQFSAFYSRQLADSRGGPLNSNPVAGHATVKAIRQRRWTDSRRSLVQEEMDPENHVPGLEVAKAFMLMPPMFVGFFTGFALTQPRPPAVVLVVVVLILAGLHLGVCGALAWICRHGGRCLGHSWIVWIVMSAIAYLLGLGANFLPD